MSISLTADGNTPLNINRGKAFSVAVSGGFDSGTLNVQYATAPAVAAALTTALTGDDNDLVFTAKDAGTAGNDLTVAYTDPAAADTALSVDFTYPDTVVTLATDSGDAASATLESTGDGNDIDITADAAGAAGNDLSVELIDPSANDAELTVNSDDYLKFTVSLATAAAGAITSTAAEVIAALNAYDPFSALATASNNGTDDGSGTVKAIAETDLTGGGDNAAITSTATEVQTAIERSNAGRFLTVADADDNDGSGVVTALAETALSSGTDGTFATYAGGDGGAFTAADERAFDQCGETDTINLNVTGTSSSATLVVVIKELDD